MKTKGTKSAKLQKICKYISAHVMQHRKPTDIYKRVNFASNQKSSSHPIRYYLENGKLSQNFHHRISKKLELIAPSERKCEELPRPWKDHVYPEWTPGVNAVSTLQIRNILKFPRKISMFNLILLSICSCSVNFSFFFC